MKRSSSIKFEGSKKLHVAKETLRMISTKQLALVGGGSAGCDSILQCGSNGTSVDCSGPC